MKVKVIGCGNILASDDGVGIEVVRALEKNRLKSNIEVVEADSAGLSLLDFLEGADKVIIVDGMITGAQPGTIHRFTYKDLRELSAGDVNVPSLHSLGILDAFKIGEKLNPEIMRREIVFIGVEIKSRKEFSVGLSPKVRKAVPKAVEAILRELA